MWQMFDFNYSMMGNYFPMLWGWGILLMLWTLPWKGYALWTAAKKGHRGWFVALFLLNTLAVLEILYIFVFSEPVKTKKIKSKK